MFLKIFNEINIFSVIDNVNEINPSYIYTLQMCTHIYIFIHKRSIFLCSRSWPFAQEFDRSPHGQCARPRGCSTSFTLSRSLINYFSAFINIYIAIHTHSTHSRTVNHLHTSISFNTVHCIPFSHTYRDPYSIFI